MYNAEPVEASHANSESGLDVLNSMSMWDSTDSDWASFQGVALQPPFEVPDSMPSHMLHETLSLTVDESLGLQPYDLNEGHRTSFGAGQLSNGWPSFSAQNSYRTNAYVHNEPFSARLGRYGHTSTRPYEADPWMKKMERPRSMHDTDITPRGTFVSGSVTSDPSTVRHRPKSSQREVTPPPHGVEHGSDDSRTAEVNLGEWQSHFGEDLTSFDAHATRVALPIEHRSSQQRELVYAMANSRADHESDDSWTAEANIGEWQSCYQENLASFDADDTRVTLLTGFLNSRRRKLIHAMAHIRRLSHMTLGVGKVKRMLISKPAIRGLPGERHCWNPAKLGRHRGLAIDPRIIIYRNHSDSRHSTFSTLRENLNAHLAELGMSVDRTWTTEDLMSTTCNLNVRFDDPIDAMAAVSSSPDFFQYVCGPIAKPKLRPNVLVRPGSKRFDLRFTVQPGAHRQPRTKPSDDSHLTSPAHSQSSRNAYESRSSQSGYVSSSSNTSHGSEIPSEYASENSNPKRKRLPPGTYECTFDRCTKTFSHAGHRTKHEKIHQRELWQYKCDECEHVFQHRKNLKRHHNNTGHENNLSASMMTGIPFADDRE